LEEIGTEREVSFSSIDSWTGGLEKGGGAKVQERGEGEFRSLKKGGEREREHYDQLGCYLTISGGADIQPVRLKAKRKSLPRKKPNEKKGRPFLRRSTHSVAKRKTL